MERLPSRIGTALLCAAVICACQKTEPPSETPAVTPASGTAGVAGGTGPIRGFNGWPIEDLVLVRDYSGGVSVPKYLFRVHMDVPVTNMSSDLENHVRNRNGEGVLKLLLNDLGRGTDRGWATLKAALGCDDFTPQNATCPPVPRSGNPQPNPDLILIKDYSDIPGGGAWPAKLLRVHMDLVLKGKNVTYDKVDAALIARKRQEVFKLLVSDIAIESNSSKTAWATLKAALGCANIDQDPTTC